MALSTPPGNVSERSLQVETLRLFTALCLARERWHGVFVVGIGLDGTGRALALALLAAGAASLFFEQDTAVLRAAQRDGSLTFVVNSLDEALRALKNEVRQGQAITVGLGGDTSRWLAEITERGVVPDVWAAECLQIQVDTLGWRIGEDAAETRAERRTRDAAFVSDGPMAAVMRRWLAAAPSLFPREKTRALWVPGTA